MANNLKLHIHCQYKKRPFIYKLIVLLLMKPFYLKNKNQEIKYKEIKYPKLHYKSFQYKFLFNLIQINKNLLIFHQIKVEHKIILYHLKIHVEINSL